MTEYVFILSFDEVCYHPPERVVVHTIFGLSAAFTKAVESAGERKLRNIALVSTTKA